MDDEIRAAFAAQTETMNAAFALLTERMTAGFARADRYFELQQAQFLEFRAEVRTDLHALTARMDALTARVDALTTRVEELEAAVRELRTEVVSLRSQFHAFRDWSTGEISEIRRHLRGLDRAAADHSALRADVQALTGRVDRLERRLDEASG